MLDYDDLPAEVRRFYNNHRVTFYKDGVRLGPTKSHFIPFPCPENGKRYKCDYCGSELLEQEIHNGTCPNCAAPVKGLNRELVIRHEVKTMTEQMLEGTFTRCPFCGTVHVEKRELYYENKVALHVWCDCNCHFQVVTDLTEFKRMREGSFRGWVEYAARQWERDIRNRDFEIWKNQ